jgi:phytoene desaturase
LKKQNIIVIGSGFGGLSAAARLAAKGHRVQIFEKRDQLGGRAYQYQIDGFKFDGGPTVITAPYIFEEIFQQAGKRADDYFQLVPLDPFYRIFHPDKRYFDYRKDLADMLEEIKKWNPADAERYPKFVDHTKGFFNLFHPYTDQPFLKLPNMLNIMPDVMRLQGYRGTYQLVSKYIKDDFLRRVFSFHPLLIGGNPFDTPSLYTLIVQFEKEWGVHYAKGGTGAIVSAFGKLLNELNVKVHYNAEVKEIIIKDDRVKGIQLTDGSKTEADVVISNGDLAFTYRHLIPEIHRKKFTNKRLDRYQYSMSLFVYYFGTKKRYLNSKLNHHNIIVGERYRTLLKEIFKGKRLPKDLALYLHMPTITDNSIAPEGCELFYVLALVPNLKANIDWENISESYRDNIISFLEENYLPDLKKNIIAEHFINPLHFQNTLNSYRGAAFAFKPTLLQSAYLRPHNRSEEFQNLYFVGAGTHPGAGVPAVLSSGKIAAELIDPEPVS